MSNVEKNIAFLIKQQFPAIYRENGPELVALIEAYYRFLETQENQSHYIARRIFEYRDINTTLESMLIFFQKKYLANLPFNQDSVRLAVKNITELYRRKGTKAGIDMFFSAFFQEQVEIIYPAKQMLKPSASEWRTGTYLQMIPNDDSFISASGVEYTYNNLVGRNITGSISNAVAAVNKINFTLLNGVITPIIYIDNVKGVFLKYDDILSNIKDEMVIFGRLNGSLSGLAIDGDFGGTDGNEVGKVYDVQSEFGNGGKAIVTKVSEEFNGKVSYTVVDGGWGYSIENTRLLVSDQIIILRFDAPTLCIGERLGNTTGTGVVIGQSGNTVGLRTTVPFSVNNINDPINTLDRPINIDLGIIERITGKNNSSPGDLFPDVPGDTVKVGSLSNQSVLSIITDTINDFKDVSLNDSDYGMSGAGAENISTTLTNAFDATLITVGTIDSFINVNPGADYLNDVFAIAVDDFVTTFNKRDQILTVLEIAGTISINDIVRESGTSIEGIVRKIDTINKTITITPFDYDGFSVLGEGAFVRLSGSGGSFEVLTIDVDFGSSTFGANANINGETEFAIGRISEVAIIDSGFGYGEGQEAFIVNGEQVQARAIVSSEIQGKTEGFWGQLSSHLNGRIEDSENPGDLSKGMLFDGGMRIQDSNFFQEYSYQIKSMLSAEQYETLLKENVHLAGTKLFSEFSFKVKVGKDPVQRFVRLFNDNGIGSPLE